MPPNYGQTLSAGSSSTALVDVPWRPCRSDGGEQPMTAKLRAPGWYRAGAVRRCSASLFALR